MSKDYNELKKAFNKSIMLMSEAPSFRFLLKHMFLLGVITALREAELLTVEEYELAYKQVFLTTNLISKEELEWLLKLCM